MDMDVRKLAFRLDANAGAKPRYFNPTACHGVACSEKAALSLAPRQHGESLCLASAAVLRIAIRRPGPIRGFKHHPRFVVLTRWRAREGRLESAIVQGGDHRQCL